MMLALMTKQIMILWFYELMVYDFMILWLYDARPYEVMIHDFTIIG